MDTEKQPIEEILSETANKIIDMIGFKADVEIVKNNFGDSLLHVVSVHSADDLGMLIGKNGQNIKALEHLFRVIVFKKLPENSNFIIDINDYRKSRANYVVEQAKTAVVRVKNTKRAEALLPMSSYERRLVHMELAAHPDIVTESIGEEPQRRVVIKPLI